MTWQVHARRLSAEDRRARVKASWTGFGGIEDVTMRCGQGVHLEEDDSPFRRAMTAFSKPLDSVVRWDDDVEAPEVILEWADSGEVLQERVPLTFRAHHRGLGAHVPHHLSLRSRRSARSR